MTKARIGLGLTAWLCAGPADAATGGTISDGSVSLTLPATHWDAGSAYGLADWKGTQPSAASDVLSRLAFWYRLEGTDTSERRLPAPTSESYAGPRAVLEWFNLEGRQLNVVISLEVGDTEGPSGWLQVRATLVNNAPDARTVSFFAYLDVDGGGGTGNDVGELRANGLLALHDSPSGDAIRIRPYTYSPAFASRWRVGSLSVVDNLMAQLDDALPTDFDDTGLPENSPTNLAAAFQRTVALTPSGGLGTGTYLMLSDRAPADVVKGDLDGSGAPDLLFQYPPSNEEWHWHLRRTQQFAVDYRGASSRVLRGVDRFYFDSPDNSRVEQSPTGDVYIDDQALVGGPTLPLNWRLAATGDFSGDGLADILWRNTTSQKLVVWVMDGHTRSGSLIPTPDQAVNGNWEIVAAADFNHDGARDLLWYNTSSRNLVIWTLDSALVRLTGSFTNPTSAGLGWRPVVAGDYGRGGGPADRPDIVWRNDTSGRLVVWHMDGAGNRTSGVFTTPDAPIRPAEAVVAGPR